MYDGKQVLRFEQKYKKKDLYNIGKEMKERKGTGNYDTMRTKFNVEYVSLKQNNLYQEVMRTLKDKNVEYLNKPSTNLLNGVTFTSGTEFFETLGMKFIDSGRTYKTGDKQGQKVKIPDIKSKEDIPQTVTYFFDSCMDFLKENVGEENIILAQIHYDEDTPHLQAYFLPIVDEVNRKCFVKDKSGKVIKEEIKKPNGEISLVPKLLRDKNGKIVYEKVKGKFLNNDQFWKNKGGKNSFTKIQNDFNKFINSRGFNLDRGKVGANIEHKTKLEFQIEENKAELKELKIEKENTLKIIEETKNGLIEANKSIEKDVLNPRKNIVGYNSNDVEKIIDYSKGLEQINRLQKTEIDNQNVTINKLSSENETLKNNEELIKRNNLIKEQKATIKEQKKEINRLNDLINILNNNIESLKEKLTNEIDKWKKRFQKLCDAIDKVLGRKPREYIEDYEDLADAINNDFYDYEKNEEKDKDDFEIGM